MRRNERGHLPYTSCVLATRIVEGKKQQYVLYIYHEIDEDERVYVWEDV